jgi:hypothetical protein
MPGGCLEYHHTAAAAAAWRKKQKGSNPACELVELVDASFLVRKISFFFFFFALVWSNNNTDQLRRFGWIIR